MRKILMLGVAVAMVTSGCGKKKGPEDKFTVVADDDPRMNAAVEKARATVQTFTTALLAPRAGQTSFSVKMAFTDGKNTEHMWLSPVTFDGTHFQGTVNNDPKMVSTVKRGQQATVAPAQISEWMFVEDRKLVGGHTLRALRDAMPAAERADFDRSVPFQVD
jgi:uncharacterized protein YegJ (DUF2314 family)